MERRVLAFGRPVWVQSSCIIAHARQSCGRSSIRHHQPFVGFHAVARTRSRQPCARGPSRGRGGCCWQCASWKRWE